MRTLDIRLVVDDDTSEKLLIESIVMSVPTGEVAGAQVLLSDGFGNLLPRGEMFTDATGEEYQEVNRLLQHSSDV